MAAMATIGIDDDLATREARITHRTANDKTTRRIDVVLHARRIIQPLGMTGLMTFSMMLRSICLLVMSGLCWVGDDDGIDADRLPVAVFDGDLRFPVGTDPGKNALFRISQPAGESMREHDRHRHELCCFVVA